MSRRLRDLFRELGDRSPRTADGEQVWRRGQRRRLLQASVMMIALVVAGGSLLRAFGSLDDGRGGDVVAQPSPAKGCPQDTTSSRIRFRPNIYSEGGRSVMGVAFLDGSTAEMVYEPSLGIEDFDIYPAGNVTLSQQDQRIGGAFRVTFEGGDPGAPVGLVLDGDGAVRREWRPQVVSHDGSELVLRLGCWIVSFASVEQISVEERELLVSNLQGFDIPSGFLMLKADPPVDVWGIEDGPSPPELQFGDEFKLWAGCHAFRDADLIDQEPVRTYRLESGIYAWCDPTEQLTVLVNRETFFPQLINGVSFRKISLASPD